MSDPISRFVARYTPLYLILFATAAIGTAVVTSGPVIEYTYYASWLIVAAALLVRLDIFLEARK